MPNNKVTGNTTEHRPNGVPLFGVDSAADPQSAAANRAQFDTAFTAGVVDLKTTSDFMIETSATANRAHDFLIEH